MANTTVSKEIEKYVCIILSKEFDQNFSEKKVTIGIKKNGEPAVYKFDAVSDNAKIVAGIKSHAGRTSSGKFPRAKVGMAYTEVFFLSRTNATKKLLILTSREFHDLFIKDCDGKIPADVEIRHLCLPEGLQNKWDKCILEGRKEMQNKEKND